MRTQLFSLLAGIAFAGMLASPMTANGEPPLPEIRLSVAAGTIVSIESKLLTLRPDSPLTPSKFEYDSGTKFIDTAGLPVPVDIIRAGDPATIHYSQRGEQFLAERVIVKPMDAEIPATVTTTTKAAKDKAAGAETPVAVPQANPSATTPTASGTIAEVESQAIAMRTESSDRPLRYTFNKSTQYFDENGQPATIEVIKTGLPATVQYVQDGEKMVARKVVVTTGAGGRKFETIKKAAVTNPVVTGTVSSVDPKTVVVRTEKSNAPARYTFTKTTEFITEEGQPVSIKAVKAGDPLTIQYVNQGSVALAQRVVVRKTLTTSE